MVKWLCLKSLRTSGVYRDRQSGSFHYVRISKWLLQSHSTILKTRNAPVLKWRKSTKFNFWLSSSFWHFDFWHCRLSAFKNVHVSVLTHFLVPTDSCCRSKLVVSFLFLSNVEGFGEVTAFCRQISQFVRRFGINTNNRMFNFYLFPLFT